MIGNRTSTTCLQGRLGDRYVHFINELDIVPQVPPDGYSHFGLALQFFHGDRAEVVELLSRRQ